MLFLPFSAWISAPTSQQRAPIPELCITVSGCGMLDICTDLWQLV
jgi:hypothetical protein